MRKLLNRDLTIRALFIGLGGLLFSSCLKEEALPIVSKFSLALEEGSHTSPVRGELTNESYGCDFYEWTFEGGEPATSSERVPKAVTFREAGEHKIKLRVWNSVEERISEQTVRVDSAVHLDFDYQVLVNDIAPAQVQITNKSQGGSSYEWTFDGADNASSKEQAPSPITYQKGGTYTIRLKAFNGSQYFETTKIFSLKAPMQADFTYEPLAVDQDMEAPLTLLLKNKTTNGVSYEWQCAGAKVQDANAETGTSVRIEQAGTYTLQLIANDGERQELISKKVVVKKNSGLLQFKDLKFGINEAQNSIGCFFSAEQAKVLTSKALSQKGLGAKIDLGFFALNSNFDYCYFFSPKHSAQNAFPKIENALHTTFINIPSSQGIDIDMAAFKGIQRAKDLAKFAMWGETAQMSFTKDEKPHFVLFKTEDNRRGIICVKDYVQAGSKSYILADIKIEKVEKE